MLKNLIKKVLGDPHEREVNRLQPLVDEINSIYDDLASLSDDELKAKTDEFRAYIEERTAELKEVLVNLLENARAAYEAAKAQVDEIREQLGDATVESPLTGVVSEKPVAAGEAVRVGDHLFTVVNTDTLELIGRVAPDQVGRIRVGQPVSLSLDAYPDRTIRGHVARIEPVAQPGTRQVNVYVRVPNEDRSLVGGLFASGTILTGAERGAVPAVPLPALLEGRGRDVVVYVVEKGRVRVRAVTLGGRDESSGFAEVRSGLKPGDRVVLSPGEAIVPGDSVRMPSTREMDPDASRLDGAESGTGTDTTRENGRTSR